MDTIFQNGIEGGKLCVFLEGEGVVVVARRDAPMDFIKMIFTKITKSSEELDNKLSPRYRYRAASDHHCQGDKKHATGS